MTTISTVLVFSALCFVVGFVTCWFLRPAPEGQYADPQIHGGIWELDHHHRTGTVYRMRYMPGISPDVSEGHQHRPHVCLIGNGLLHTDRCACGAERDGVYGKWVSYPPT